MVTTPFDRWVNKFLGAFESWHGAVADLRTGGDAMMRSRVFTLADMFEQLCRETELPVAARQFEFIRNDIRDNVPDLTDEKLADRVQLAVRSLRRDLQDQFFYRAPAAKRGFYNADFGAGVDSSFKSAVLDIREANNCYALERNTASVFHSMRCVEIGLQALARERRIKPKKGPVEWQEWYELIRDIRKKVEEEWPTFPKGPIRNEFQSFYLGALLEFEGFKDEFRNHVSHSRVSYDEATALRVINAVREFLTRLANKGINEKGHKIRWPRK